MWGHRSYSRTALSLSCLRDRPDLEHQLLLRSCFVFYAERGLCVLDYCGVGATALCHGAAWSWKWKSRPTD